MTQQLSVTINRGWPGESLSQREETNVPHGSHVN